MEVNTSVKFVEDRLTIHSDVKGLTSNQLWSWTNPWEKSATTSVSITNKIDVTISVRMSTLKQLTINMYFDSHICKTNIWVIDKPICDH